MIAFPGYTDYMASVILDRVHDRGWNVYREGESFEEVIRAGDEHHLEPNRHYVFVLAIDDPTDLDALMARYKKTKSVFPQATIAGRKYPMHGFMLESNTVIPSIPPGGPYIAYSDVLAVLDTLTPSDDLFGE